MSRYSSSTDRSPLRTMAWSSTRRTRTVCVECSISCKSGKSAARRHHSICYADSRNARTCECIFIEASRILGVSPAVRAPDDLGLSVTSFRSQAQIDQSISRDTGGLGTALGISFPPQAAFSRLVAISSASAVCMMSRARETAPLSSQCTAIRILPFSR